MSPLVRKQTVNKRGSYLVNGRHSLAAEQYKTIRTNLEFASVDRKLRSFFVTSPGPGEGKSTTAANLAVVFSEQGKRVILIDADMRKPTLHYTFSSNNGVGLSTYLAGQKTSVTNVIQETAVENLDIITSGPVPPNPAELLGGSSVKTLMNELKSTYDLIIFDTPPVLSVTDSQLLAPHTEGVVLVVRSRKTRKEEANKAKEVLLHSQARILGAVLNGNEMGRRKKNYYYYA
nr:CpsD/CapB family tyrosine-protein kinase [Salimicrobium humidisoli]